MKLIIAEKPSMARSIKTAIERGFGEKFYNKKEYWESQNFYVTSAFGHLYELLEPDGYDPVMKKWRKDTLPFFPKKYQYTVKPGCSDRVETIKTLSGKVDEIIHAGDPDREGQIIVDIILIQLGLTANQLEDSKVNVSRLWIQDLEDKTICQGLKDRKPNSEYKNLSLEGRFRQVSDWSYGINLTRYATLNTGNVSLLNVGRVIDAIVAIVCERDREIRNFVPSPYYQLEFPLSEDVSVMSKPKHDDKTNAEKQLEEYLKADTLVKSVKKRQVTKRPPKLFSQTKLQNECSKRFGWSADETLALSQKLYEAGLTTYPRTDSEYLSPAEKDKVKGIIEAHTKAGAKHMQFRDTKQVFDGSKVGAHTAIIPTTKVHVFKNPDSKEAKCYGVIFNRFLANFYDEDFLVDKTEIVLEVIGIDGTLEELKTSGEVMKQPGWSVLTGSKSDKLMPPVKKGEILPGPWKITEKMTSPPAHFTVETLNNMLENPFKKEFETEDETYKKLREGKSIGTESTRAGIIAKAIDRGFIRMDKKTYRITPNGEYLVDVLDELQIDMTKEKTVELSAAATAIGNGSALIGQSLNTIYKEIAETIGKNIRPRIPMPDEMKVNKKYKI